MTKQERANLLRVRFNAPRELNEKAVRTLEELRDEDPDLGDANATGFIASETVELVPRITTDDENERDTELISPHMRQIVEPCSPSSSSS